MICQDELVFPSGNNKSDFFQSGSRQKRLRKRRIEVFSRLKSLREGFDYFDGLENVSK